MSTTGGSGPPVRSGGICSVGIFKACDVRGTYGLDLTPEVGERMGLAVGTELAGRTVVVGGDLRPSTTPLKGALVRGLMATGSRVVDVGVLPTPAFYFAKDELRAEGGVMVTGSHNPPGDNGFKISLGPLPISGAELARLAGRVERGQYAYAQGEGSFERRDLTDAYRTHIRGKFLGSLDAPPALDGFKVAVDAGNGCYVRIAPQVLRDLGCDVVELYCEPDGRFPNRSPNPSVAANLADLGETVVEAGAQMGVGYDGDGDRAVFVDELGRVVASDRSIVLFARRLLARGPGEVVHDIKCSSVVPEEVRRAGGVPVMERSGHAFIKTTLLRRGALLGGEISGHFFFDALGRDDGLYATLLMAHIVTQSGCGLAALADTVPQYVITPDIRLPCAPEVARSIVQELAEAFAAKAFAAEAASGAGCEVSTLDGVRIAWPDGWALVRPSVTEPLITLRFEAHTEGRLAQIQALVASRSAPLSELMAQRDGWRA